MTSPPAALSLETPACWSFSPSFHLPPSALKSLSSLVHLSLPTFSSSPFFQHPPYSPFTVPPFSLSLSPLHPLSMSLALFVGISLADVVHWEPVIVCGWEQRRRAEPITAMQSNQTTSQRCSRRCVCICACMYSLCAYINGLCLLVLTCICM